MRRLPLLVLTMAASLSACDAPEVDAPGRGQDNLLTPRSDGGIGTAEQSAPAGVEREASIVVGDAAEAPDILAAPEPAAAEPAPADIIGEWAAEQWQCGTGQGVTVAADSFEYAAGICEIDELVAGADGFTASMRCERGGVSEPQLLKLTPEGERLLLDWVARDEPEMTLVRCG